MLAQRLLILLIVTGWAESHVEAAVDPPRLAGDVPGGVGGEEVDDSRDLLRLRETAHGDLGPDLLQRLLRHRFEHLRGDEARGDGVDRDADAVAAELSRPDELEQRLARQGLRQAEQTRFLRRVVRLADAARASRDEGDPADQLALGCEVDRGAVTVADADWAAMAAS